MRYFTILLFFFVWNQLYPQTSSKINFYKIPPGISDNHIMSIFQDSKGFMWFGTQNGLNKFDGYAYTIYENETDDPSSIARNFISNIYEDNLGNLWISTIGGGLNYLDRRTNRFTLYKKGDDDKHLSNDVVRSVFQEIDGLIWIAVKNGLNLFNPQTKKFQHFVFPNDLSELEGTDIINILKVSHQYIWIATKTKGIIRFDKISKKFTNFTEEQGFLKENAIICTTPSAQKDKFWIGYNSKGISLISLKNDQLVLEKNYSHDPNNPQSIAGNLITALCEDSQGQLWVGVKDIGINLLNLQTDKFVLYQHSKKDKLSPASNHHISIYEDKFGNIWLGNFGQGLNVVYNQYHQKFEHYYQDSENTHSLSNNSAISFWETKEGKIWIGTDGGGGNEWDRGKNTFSSYTTETSPPLQISGNTILCITEDKDGNAWMGTWDKGINRYNAKNHSFKSYTKSNTNLSSNIHFDIVQGKDGLLYLAGFESVLEVFDIEKGKVLWSKKFSEYGIDLLFNIAEDKNENLWIGTENGLILLDKANRRPDGKAKVFKHIPGQANSLSENHANAFEDSQGNIWVGTANGLCKYLPQTQTFEVYTKKDGLPSDFIKAMMDDTFGNLWIATTNGLSKMNIAKKTFENFTKEDGLQDNDFGGGIYRTRKGEILVGGGNGFNLFDPAKMQKNPFTPKVYFKDFKIFNKSVDFAQKDSPLKIPIELTKEITLTYQQSVFTLEFVGINYTRPEKNQYAYKLEPLEKDWNYVGNKREATYTSLPAGTYTFRVKAANNDGVWSTEETTLKIIILPPWWETWWFRTIAITLFLSSGIIFYFYRINAIKAQNRKLEAQVIQRTRELSEAYESLQTSEEELRQNQEEIIAQRDFIENQNKNLSQQNTQIKNSINAALTIQKAILPTNARLNKILKDYYLIYQPKDIVSGDFYLVEQLEDKTILVAADCTGHGVPGAFMSLISSNLLGKIILAIRDSDPATILEQLHKQVCLALNQEESGNNYGLDISIAILEPMKENQQKIIFAGAKRPLYYISANNPTEVQVLPGTRKSIGGIQNEATQFENQILELPAQSMIYLSSDGLIDQNNSKRDRLGTKKVFETILNSFPLNTQEQKQNLLDLLGNHMRNTTQRDDILWLGVRV